MVSKNALGAKSTIYKNIESADMRYAIFKTSSSDKLADKVAKVNAVFRSLQTLKTTGSLKCQSKISSSLANLWSSGK